MDGKNLFEGVRDASLGSESQEIQSVREFPGYAIASDEIKLHYNADGSMKEAAKRQYLAIGYTEAQIRSYEADTRQELQDLSAKMQTYERNYGRPYSVTAWGIDDPPEAVKRAANLQAIRDGDDPSELPYDMDVDEYYDQL